MIATTPPGGAASRVRRLGRGVQHRPAAPGVGDAATDREVPACPGPGVEPVVEPSAVPAVHRRPVVEPSAQMVRLPGVQRWVDQHGLISLGGFRYRVPIVLAGEPVEAVVADHLVRIFHREVLVAEHVQRRKPDTGQRQEVRLGRAAAARRRATDGLMVTRVADSSGSVSFAGTNYRVGNRWRGRSAQVCDRGRFGAAVLRRPDRARPPDPARPGQRARRVRHPERAAPPPTGCAGRCRRQGQAAARSACRPSLDPDPLTRRRSRRRGTTQPAEQC